MSDANEATSRDLSIVDAFLLYNEKEENIEPIAAALEERGLSLHFFRRDIDVGDEFGEIEAKRLRSARSVVVLLGDSGWGPTQFRLAREARSLEKPLLPVLIGNPPESDLDELDGLFRKHLYADLRELSSAGLDSIVSAVDRQPKSASAPRFDQLIGILIDGSDASRSALLDRLIEGDFGNGASLAIRLRHLIRNEFSRAKEAETSKALRESKRIASIRSWLLSTLIWLDADDPDTRALVLEHLDPGREFESNIRFWLLASLKQRRADYLSEAVGFAIGDPAPEVADLARAIADPQNKALIRQLQGDLQSTDFQRAWHVLRVLRVVAIPALAPTVRDQLERDPEEGPLPYDALFALANPEMAAAARSLLLERPGIERLVAIVLDQSSDANDIAVRSFARFLTVFDRDEVRRALEAAATDEESGRLARLILLYMREADRQDSGDEVFVPGHASDTIDVSKDDIGIAQDVETLAAVMMAREVTPPMAIGLFGAWGSGKSFFMRSIREAAGRIEERAKQTEKERPIDAPKGRFCSNIVQIDFNAWHYSDANLWASLVSHILDNLSAHVSPGASPAQQQLHLQAQLESTQADIASAEADHERAQRTLADAQVALERLRVERERKEVRLRDLRASDLARLLGEDATLKGELVDALDRVGAPAAVESIQDLNRIVEESYSTGGRAAALVTSLVKGQSRQSVAVCLALLLAAPLVIWLALSWVGSDAIALLSAASAELVLLLGSAAAFVRSALARAKAGLASLSEAKNKVDLMLAAKRAEPSAEEDALEHDIARARAGEQEAGQRLAVASALAVDIEARVAALKESQSLGYFLAERSRSDDYRRHLGLISVIRKDFETLVGRLQSPPTEDQKPVDRIILYIDDLDRCSSTMVVDVLQAVHLLLAYPLFVVVVSVDPRWLLRSLESRYRHFKRGEQGGDDWAATPQDYLEKIFQIPFSVRPMGDRGFSRLIGRLFGQTRVATDRSDSAQTEDGEAGANSFSVTKESEELVEATQTRNADPGGTPESSVTQSGESTSPEERRPGDVQILEEALSIQEVESAFASRLHSFIPTPRAAKRFANIYRILKARVSRDQLGRHEGTIELPGDFRLPMLLLALLVGHPDEAARLFPRFLARARAGQHDFWNIEDEEDDAPALKSIRTDVSNIASDSTFPNGPRLVRKWLPRVARFSFGTARLVTEDE
jgi:hypothetical protein